MAASTALFNYIAYLLFPFSMKQFLLTLGLVLASLSGSLAQRGGITNAVSGGRAGSTPPIFAPPITAFADSINAVFQYLDKNRVPSGILEEYGLQLVDHLPYTGTNGFTTDNQFDINHWRALYGDLFGARINSNAAGMPSLAIVNQQLAIYAQEPSVELPILHFDYHSIRTDALSSGLIRSMNNRLYDVAGQVPYQLNTAFGVAASTSDLPSACVCPNGPPCP